MCFERYPLFPFVFVILIALFILLLLLSVPFEFGIIGLSADGDCDVFDDNCPHKAGKATLFLDALVTDKCWI